jgi:hypothetical protein
MSETPVVARKGTPDFLGLDFIPHRFLALETGPRAALLPHTRGTWNRPILAAWILHLSVMLHFLHEAKRSNQRTHALPCVSLRL